MNAIHWMLIEGMFKGREKSALTLSADNMASLRMRAFPAVKAMEEKGFEVTFGERVTGQPSKIFVGKISGIEDISRIPIYLGELRQHKERGAKIYVDYTENHLGLIKPNSGFYLEAMKITDVAVVPSQKMAKLLKAFFSGDIVVIEDALEVCVQPVKEHQQKILTFLWFGHGSNIQYLKDFVRTGFRAGDVAKIIVLSNNDGVKIFKAGLLQSNANLEIDLRKWSRNAMLEAAKLCDACIIPSDIKDLNKSGASSNRLITALAMGLPTAADNLESYKEFSEFYVDIRSDKFRTMMAHPDSFNPIVVKAQEDILPRFSFDKIKQAWGNLV